MVFQATVAVDIKNVTNHVRIFLQCFQYKSYLWSDKLFEYLNNEMMGSYVYWGKNYIFVFVYLTDPRDTC